MPEIFIIFLYVLSLSAIAHPDDTFVFTFLFSTLVSIIFIKNKPDKHSLIWFLGLFILYVFGAISQINNKNFVFSTSLIYFSMQSGLIIGSTFSSIYYISKENCKLFIQRVRKKYVQNKNLIKLLYILTLLIIFIPISTIFIVLIINPYEIAIDNSILSFSENLQNIIGLILKAEDALGFSNDSEKLQSYPRLILSKSAITFSLLALNSICWIFFKKRIAFCLNILLIFIFSGFRSGAYGMIIQLISATLIENRFIKFAKIKVLIAFLISLSYLIPFCLLFIGSDLGNKLYDRLPSFKAALYYASNINFFGATFGSYWKYTVENNSDLTKKFGSSIYQVYEGSEHLAGELLGSIGVIGLFFFCFMNITRILKNLNEYSIIRGLRKPSLMILLLQIGLTSSGIGGAINLIGFTYYIIMGWSIRFINIDSDKILNKDYSTKY